MTARHERPPPRKMAAREKNLGGQEKTDSARSGQANHSAIWWRVIAVAANGRRTVAGLFRQRGDAERHAAQLLTLARITGGNVLVEVAP